VLERGGGSEGKRTVEASVGLSLMEKELRSALGWSGVVVLSRKHAKVQGMLAGRDWSPRD
jgi:hypothetical protein